MTKMSRQDREKNRQIAKRLTAILVAVVFVFGMMYIPAEIYAVETDAAGDAVVTDTTGASDEAAATDSSVEAVDPEAAVPEEAVAEEAAEEAEKVPADEESTVDGTTIDELSDAVTVDLESLDESEYDGFIYKLEDNATKKEVKAMERAINDLDESEGQAVEEVVEKELYTADSIETIAEVADPAMIEYIEPNYIVRALSTDDPLYGEYGWYLDMINAPYVWDKSMFGDGITIAVLDSGVKVDHDEFEETTFIGQYNAMDDSQDLTDNAGHGTAVTGIIAAAQNNQKGLTGIVPHAKVIPVKVMDYDSTSGDTVGSISGVVKGMNHALDYGADVINISAGSTEDNRAMREACQKAAARGVIVVAAAGNDYCSIAEYPAAYDTVIGVGSIERDGAHSDFSNYNQSVAVSAPGRAIRTPYRNGGYVSYTGTSFSAPQVAAMAVIIKQMDSSVNCAGFMKIIAATSTDKGPAGYDPEYGYGLMNLEKAYCYMAGDISMYEAALSSSSYVYDGKAKTPGVTVYKAARALSSNYYTTTYAAGRAAVGTYKVTVAGRNGYAGSRVLSFNVVPPLVKGIKAPKRGKKKLTVRWKAMSKKQKKKTYKNVITGYQVRVSTSSNFANAKYASVKGIAKTSKTVKGLKKKTTYYVQYRSYKTVGSTTYYSKWSGKKKAKTK